MTTKHLEGVQSLDTTSSARAKEHILTIRKLHLYFGYKRMTRALSREGIVVNYKRVQPLMRD